MMIFALYSGSDHVRNEIGGNKKPEPMEADVDIHRFSFALMGITICSIKSLAGVLRPDGSDFLSFPSGHTATAFTSACLLYKEYGPKSSWIGVAAFLPAFITGLIRQLNNRHWLSDVVGGAVIGILMVEVGYCLSGLLFKEKGNRSSLASIVTFLVNTSSLKQ